MKSKKQWFLSGLAAFAVLVALAVGLAPAPTADAAPRPPTAVCGPLNQGTLTTTETGFSIPQCPEGLYNLWQCSVDGNGNFFWDYQGRTCGPVIGF